MTTPLWENPLVPSDGPLGTDRHVDVCVVGGGVAGLTAAVLLAADGARVLVIEQRTIGDGESRRTTAQLVNGLDRGWARLLAVHGADAARRAADSHTAAIDWIEHLVARERIACDFTRVDGFLFGEADALADELDATRAVGLCDVALAARPPVDGFGARTCLRFPRQARLEPSRYLRGLAELARRRGVALAAPTQAVAIDEDDGLRVRTAGGPTVEAHDVVVATNTPFNTRVALHVKQAAYRSYVIALPIRPGTVPDALYWDTEDPFHYVRLAPGTADGDLLVVGGEDHKTGQDRDGHATRYARLETWARAHFPVVGPPVARWSGQVMESMDGLGFIGPIEDGGRIHVVTGDSGDGYTNATIGGLIVSDLVAGRANAWAATYDPSRVRVRALGTLAADTASVARQLGAWVEPGDAEDEAAVEPGCGAVVRHGLSPVAVYRDPSGVVHACSAVCPHLGCIVRWNAGERSWDCPCHGSRFDPHGRLLHGPSPADLAPAQAVEGAGAVPD